MTTDDERLLLKAVIQNPDDDAPRLAYADWCDRRGDPRGRFIRVQLELAKIGKNFDHPNWNSLRSENLNLLSLHRREWMPENHPYISSADFNRGFVADVTMRAEMFLAHTKELFAQYPIQHAHITELPGKSREVLTSPLLIHLCAATFRRGGITDDDIIAFAQSPFVANFWWLDLDYNNIGMAGVEALANSKYLKDLGFVGLSSNPCNPVETAGFDQGTLTDIQLPEEGKLLEKRYGPLKWLRYRQVGPLLRFDQR
jgi:uncharacterized protein (TIGR02996 family)